MESISIRPDLKALILQEVASRGVSPSDVIEAWRQNGQHSNTTLDEEVAESTSDERLQSFLSSSEFQRKRYAIERYLALVSFLHSVHGEELDQITSLGGHRRKYFARDRESLVRHGVDVNPKRVPGTPYWGISRLSNRDKREILTSILQRMGYGAGSVSRVRSAFPSG